MEGDLVERDLTDARCTCRTPSASTGSSRRTSASVANSASPATRTAACCFRRTKSDRRARGGASEALVSAVLGATPRQHPIPFESPRHCYDRVHAQVHEIEVGNAASGKLVHFPDPLKAGRSDAPVRARGAARARGPSSARSRGRDVRRLMASRAARARGSRSRWAVCLRCVGATGEVFGLRHRRTRPAVPSAGRCRSRGGGLRTFLLRRSAWSSKLKSACTKESIEECWLD